MKSGMTIASNPACTQLTYFELYFVLLLPYSFASSCAFAFVGEGESVVFFEEAENPLFSSSLSLLLFSSPPSNPTLRGVLLRGLALGELAWPGLEAAMGFPFASNENTGILTTARLDGEALSRFWVGLPVGLRLELEPMSRGGGRLDLCDGLPSFWSTLSPNAPYSSSLLLPKPPEESLKLHSSSSSSPSFSLFPSSPGILFRIFVTLMFPDWMALNLAVTMASARSCLSTLPARRRCFSLICRSSSASCSSRTISFLRCLRYLSTLFRLMVIMCSL